MFHGVAFRQELVIGVVAVALAWTLPGLDVFWGVLLTLCWLLLPTTEVLNTAIEDVVDLASPGIHPLAKRAKDLGSAAVLLICI
ncbi:MAG: diacylglycerol kinase, partial [Lentisphaeria bacterium]|nr:diacylglycerol kinase [Lentisphaeria bacterium]